MSPPRSPPRRGRRRRRPCASTTPPAPAAAAPQAIAAARRRSLVVAARPRGRLVVLLGGALQRRGRARLALRPRQRCARSRSARTRSSTPPTARSSARSRPSRTASPSRSQQISPWLRRRRSRSRTAASTSTAGSTPRASRGPLWARRPGRQGRAGRLDDHAAARPQPLHLARADDRAQGEGGLPRDQARTGRWSKHRILAGVHEPGLLRQPRVRRRGGGADVLLEARAQPDARRRRRCSPACRRRRRSTTRSASPSARSRAATRCCARMLENGDITRAQYREAVAHRRPAASSPGRLYKQHPRAVLLQLRARGADQGVRRETVRSGGLRVYTTIDRRFQQLARKAIRDTLYLTGRPGRGARLDQPAQRSPSAR